MKYFYLSFLFSALVFSSCDSGVKMQVENQKSPKVRNGIQLKSEGITVEQAFLIDDKGALLPEDNKVNMNQKIQIHLIVSGWTEKEGKVFIEASEKAETSEGGVLLDEKDLFAEYKDGINAEDAGFLNLSFELTKIDKLYDYFKVSFRVVDKNDAGKYVEGSYKLYL